MKAISLTLLLLVLALASGCKKGERVLADVNGQPVTQPKFDAFLDFKRIPADDEKRRDAALTEFLDREALAAVIEKQTTLDKNAIDAELNEFRKEMLISRYFDKFLDDKVTDEAVKNYYEAHAKDYEQRKVHVAHILVRTNARMDETTRKAKLTTAQEAFSKLQGGEAFEAVAEKYSEDRISGSKGGDLGWVKEGTIDPRFSQRAFETKAGTVTEPFETPFGFHIVKVIEEPQIVRRPLSSVVGDIRYQLRNEAKEAELKRLKGLADIKKKTPYQLDPKRLEEQKAKKSQKDQARASERIQSAGRQIPPSAAPEDAPENKLGAPAAVAAPAPSAAASAPVPRDGKPTEKPKTPAAAPAPKLAPAAPAPAAPAPAPATP